MNKIIAPAKVNLFLHIIGKNKDDYHLLQSLVTFADFGDVITITPSDKYRLETVGEFSANLSQQDNLITTAVQGLEELTGEVFNFDITLEKNIPTGAGLGGGSTDAAAIIKALLDIKEITIDENKLLPFLTKLGADVPVCFGEQTTFVEGIGEKITPITLDEKFYAVLIYPHQHSSTVEIFKHFQQDFRDSINTSSLESLNAIEFLNDQYNDLTRAAITKNPVINDVLDTLQHRPNCILARMTGSGSCCFGLFKNDDDAQKVSEIIQQENPQWWVKKTVLNAN